VNRRDRVPDRARQVHEIVHRENRDVEQIASEQIANREINRFHSRGGNRNDDFRERGRDREKHIADETRVETGRARDVIAEKR
jgi:hypothetical protein